MKEPEINVGIVSAKEIHFTLNGQFFAKGETVSGNQMVSFSEGGILWNENQYRELTFTPLEEKKFLFTIRCNHRTQLPLGTSGNTSLFWNLTTCGRRRQDCSHQHSSGRRLPH